MGERVNRSVLRGLSDVFGSNRDSDCVVIFCRDENAPTPAEPLNTPEACGQEGGREIHPATGDGSAASEVVFGEPLPAHRLILRLASERFAAQLERWPVECTGRVTEPSQTEPPAGAAVSQPQLRIPLGSEAEVPAARAAIRFAYTGEVAADISVREVLEVRRQGAYLQIKDCVAACDRALESRLQGSTANAGASTADSSNKRRRTEAPQQQPVFDLYGSEALWPDPQVEASFAAVLAVGKRRLVARFRNTLQTLNRPSLRDQLVTLPAVALEALLESDDFGTDSESTVLLLLAVWMKANFEKTSAEIRKRLCRTIRLAHLSRPYLSMVLPALAGNHEKDPEGPAGWFSGASAMEAAFIANFTSASENERLALLAIQEEPSFTAWLTVMPRAQCISPADGLTYSWHITKGQLKSTVELLELEVTDSVFGVFDELPLPQDGPSAWGFNWSVSIELTSGQPSAGLYMHCRLPDALVSPGSRLSGEDSLAVCTVVPISARLTVHHRQGRAQSNVQIIFSSSEDFVSVGSSYGWYKVLPLREQQRQQPRVAAGGTTAGVSAVDPLAAWVDYLRDDKIMGTLTLLRPA